MEGKDEILAAMEQARQDSDGLRRESDALKRDLSTMQASRGRSRQEFCCNRVRHCLHAVLALCGTLCHFPGTLNLKPA